jgi:hypothetical protein
VYRAQAGIGQRQASEQAGEGHIRAGREIPPPAACLPRSTDR